MDLLTTSLCTRPISQNGSYQQLHETAPFTRGGRLSLRLAYAHLHLPSQLVLFFLRGSA